MNWSAKPLSALLTVLLVVLAGCTGAITGDMDGEEIAAEIDDRHENIEDIQGEQEVEMTMDGETTTTTYDVWEQPPHNQRMEVTASDGPYESTGDVTVVTDEEVISYNSDENEYTRMDISGFAEENPGMYSAEMIDEMLEMYDIEYVGDETVADRETHVLELTPKPDDEVDDEMVGAVSLTLYVDTEYWYPLKQQSVYEFDGETMETTMRFTDVSFNEGVDDDRFSFDPPAGAEEAEHEIPETETFDDVESAAADTPFALEEPTAPDGFELTSVTVSEYEDESATQLWASYESDDAHLSLTVSEEYEQFGDEDGEPVEIGDSDGERYDRFGMTELVWTCGDDTYTVSGDLEEEELLAFAESVGCE